MFGALQLGLGLTPRTGSRGVRAYAALANKDNGFAFDPLDDFVLVKDAGTPANNFCGSMAQALAAGILVNPSPPTKYLRDSSGILRSGTALRCHHSAAGVPLGFLPEPQRTRLNTYPTQFDHVAWSKTNTTVTPDAVASPINGYSADYIVAAVGGGSTRDVRRNVTASQASAATFNAIVAMKAGECRYAFLQMRDSTNGSNNNGAEFDLQSGVITFAASNAGTATGGVAAIAPFGTVGGITFYHISLTGVLGGGGPSISCVLFGRTTSNNNTVADGLGWYTAAAWLEQGAFPTSLILGDETTTVTRAADNLYVDLTMVPFGAEYTVIAHAQPSPDSANSGHVLFSVGDNTVDERHALSNQVAAAAGLNAAWRTGSVLQAFIGGAGWSGSAFKAATATKADDFELVSNGVSRGTDAAGTVPVSPTRLQIGASYTAILPWAAPIGFLALIPERLSQADMIARTS